MLLGRVSDSDSYTREDEFSADLNVLWEYRPSDQINIKLKTGGNYKLKTRKYDYNELFFSLNEPKAKAYAAILEKWPWMSQYFNPSMAKFPFEPFIDKDYDPGDFMAGNYELVGVPDKNLGIDLIHHLENSLGINWSGAATPQEFTPDFHASGRNDYHGTEKYGAWYLMPTVAIGTKITLIPGVRYEYNQTRYTAVRGNALLMREESQGFIHYDTTFTRKNEFWLPMLHARIRPVQGFDIRASYTQTLSRPSYMEFLPSWYIQMLSIDYKNPNLRPSKSNNLDLQFSLYGDRIGLFTIGAFQKTIKDMVYSRREVILSDSMAVQKYGLTPEATGQDPSKFRSRPIESYVNNQHKADLWGIETEWQSNFWFLPGLLRNFVMNVNYTHTFSKAKYPRTIPVKKWVMVPFPMEVVTSNIDTFYTAPLLYQPDDILNLTLGYDYMGFSIRGSLQYKSDIFSANSWRPELRGHTDAFMIYDLSVTQKLPLKGLILFGNFKNLTKTIEKDINDGTGYITNEEYYGMTADLGIKYVF